MNLNLMSHEPDVPLSGIGINICINAKLERQKTIPVFG